MSDDVCRVKRGRRRSFLGLVRLMARNRSGATAVEFALVGLPFLFTLYALIETAYTYYVEQSLYTAVRDASRKILTRQYGPGTSLQTFKAEICKRTLMIDCAGTLNVDVKPMTAVTKDDIRKPVNGSGQFESAGFDISVTSSDSYILVRAAYMHKSFSSMLSSFNNYMNGGTLIMTSYVFRIEPTA